ncbi:hypothetical protein P5673_006970 [Acropora cervicornis]|uniref:Uncharacterized protein n=1 Tax=Acropora cervicornis TaxID=6130 RepID=A0AAD9QWR6_ACRCE|nr:hypothetical protein P5673_006970 [Acropora cervicornis]
MNCLPVNLKLPSNPCITNWIEHKEFVSTILSATRNRLTKGLRQGSFTGPYLLILFPNDLNIALRKHEPLFKYADVSTMLLY